MKTIKLDGKNIPARNVVQIKLVVVSDELFKEFTYIDNDGWSFKTLVPNDKGCELEKIVRKEMEKANRYFG